jgi:hypothetical protein
LATADPGVSGGRALEAQVGRKTCAPGEAASTFKPGATPASRFVARSAVGEGTEMKSRPFISKASAVFAVICLTSGLLASARVAGATPSSCKARNVDSRENFNDLAAAIAAASARDTIKVKGTCVGTFLLRRDLTLRSWNKATLATLDADQAGRVLTVKRDVTATVIGVVITHGVARSGGGIANSGTLTLIDSVVRANRADGDVGGGGGIANGFGALTLRDSVVEQNRAEGRVVSGGGIDSNSGTVTLNDTIVRGNTVTAAVVGDGGGIFSGFGPLAVKDSIVQGNTVSAEVVGDGGGIFSNFGPLALTDSLVQGNTAAGDSADGGGVFNNFDSVVMNDSVVRDNTASGDRSADGGGILNNFGDVTLNGSSRVTSNVALGPLAEGGGIDSSGTVTLNDASAVFGNIPDDCFPASIC